MASGFRSKRKIVSNKDFTDTIPFKMDNWIIFKIRIDNNEIDCFFDTGAGITCIDSLEGLKTSKEAVNLIDILGCSNQAYYSKKIDLQVTNNIDHKERVTIAKMFSSPKNILGMDIIGRYVWKIDFIKKEIITSNDISNLKKNANTLAIPFYIKDNCPHISARINDVEMNFLIDFGNAGIGTFNKDSIDSHNLEFPNEVTWYNNYAARDRGVLYNNHALISDTTQSLLTEIKLGDKIIKEELFNINSNVGNNLGLNFFMNFEYVIFDFPNRLIYLGNYLPKSIFYFTQVLEKFNTIGIHYKNGEYPIITNVTASAKSKGVNLGDTIKYINGKKVYEMDSVYRKSGDIKIAGIEHANVRIYRYSEQDSIKIDCSYLANSSEIIIKKGNNDLKINLQRNKYKKKMPSEIFIHEYTPKLIVPHLRGAVLVPEWGIIDLGGNIWSFEQKKN